MFARALTLLLLVAATSSVPNQREKRGLLQDMFGSLHRGYGQFEAAAREDLVPLAEQLEEQMRPTLRTMHHELRGALGSLTDQLARNPVFGFTNIDRQSGEPVVTQDRHPSVGDGVERPIDSVGHPALDQFFTQAMDPFRFFRMSRRNWWEGSNVCVDRDVIEEEKEEEEEEAEQKKANGGFFMMHTDMTMTSCRDGDNFHECTTRVMTNGKRKTVVVTHKCCYGFERVPGEMGCTKMVMKPLAETVADLGAEEFLDLVDVLDMRPVLEQNVTLFVPSDEAIEDFRRDVETVTGTNEETMRPGGDEGPTYNIDSGLAPKRRRRKRSELTVVEEPDLGEILKGHIVEGSLDTSQMHDEDVISTMAEGGDTKLRITMYNTYPKKTVMANCARLVSSDHFSSNGVVHMVDRVIQPAKHTIGDIIENDIELRSVAAALRKAGLMERLKEPGQQLTFFAPNDAAFESLDEAVRAKVEKGNGCSRDLLNHHLLPNAICTGVIDTRAKSVNEMKKFVSIERDSEDELFVDGVQVVIKDLVGTNGVLHVIDGVIVPPSARSSEDALVESGLDKFNELVQLADLGEHYFSNKTIFAPSNRALGEMPAEVLEGYKTDSSGLKEFLDYHTASPKTCKCDFEDNKLMESGIEGKRLRVNSYSPFGMDVMLDGGVQGSTTTVQCAKIVRLDEEACGTMVHGVDKVLLPPGGNVIEILKDHGRFGKFVELVEFAGLTEELNGGEGPVTVLAPTDGAMDNLRDEYKEKMMEDSEAAALFVRHHVLRDMLCCAGIPRQMPFFDLSRRRTMAGDLVSVQRSHGGYIYADRSEVTTCDMVADNGVVHAIDRVMIPAHFTQRRRKIQQAVLEPDAEVIDNVEAGQRSDSPFVLFNLFQ